MKKKAFLISCSLMTRIIADEDTSEDNLIDMARSKFIEKIQTELGDNIEEVIDDEECPYDPEYDDKRI